MGGAVEKVWYELGQEFALAGHEILHLGRAHPELARRERIQNVDYLRVRGYDQPSSLLRLKLLDLFYSIRITRQLPRADILVINTFWLPILLRSKKHGSLYIHVARFPKNQMGWYAHADRLQAVSNPVVRAICEQTPAVAAKTVMIPYFVPDTCFFESQPRPSAAARTILYVGRVHPEKGVGLLLEGFTEFCRRTKEPWCLRVVGPWQSRLGGGGEEYLAQLKLKAEGIQGSVDWVGPVFEPELLNGHFRAAKLFVYPSLAEKGEAFGLAPLEAMANGCPALVSSLECFQDFITPNCTGYVFDHRKEDAAAGLADSLMAILSDPENLDRVADQGLNQAQNYRRTKIAALFLNDFYTLCSANERSL